MIWLFFAHNLMLYFRQKYGPLAYSHILCQNISFFSYCVLIAANREPALEAEHMLAQAEPVTLKPKHACTGSSNAVPVSSCRKVVDN